MSLHKLNLNQWRTYSAREALSVFHIKTYINAVTLKYVYWKKISILMLSHNTSGTGFSTSERGSAFFTFRILYVSPNSCKFFCPFYRV